MSSINLAVIAGRLGKDAELSYTPKGVALCKFSVATESRWEKDGEAQTATTWHSVALWGKYGEAMAPHLTKGKTVTVTGEIVNRSWDKADGTKGYATDIKANTVVLGGDGAGTKPLSAPPARPTRRTPTPVPVEGPTETITDDDIPF